MAEPAYLSMMPDFVRVYRRLRHNSYGEPVWSTQGSTWRCRLAGKTGFVRNANNETVPIRSILWVHSTGDIRPDDRVLLSDGTSPPVVNLERYPDERGTHHYKITLGW